MIVSLVPSIYDQNSMCLHYSSWMLYHKARRSHPEKRIHPLGNDSYVICPSRVPCAAVLFWVHWNSEHFYRQTWSSHWRARHSFIAAHEPEISLDRWYATRGNAWDKGRQGWCQRQDNRTSSNCGIQLHANTDDIHASGRYMGWVGHVSSWCTSER